jgi:hypothetical protein
VGRRRVFLITATRRLFPHVPALRC